MNLNNLKVKEIDYGQNSEIREIIFENGIIAVPEEDTGGEISYMIIDGYKLKVGDIISFDYILDEFDCICNLEWVEVDGYSYRAWVESEGGNDCTYLSFSEKNLI